MLCWGEGRCWGRRWCGDSDRGGWCLTWRADGRDESGSAATHSQRRCGTPSFGIFRPRVQGRRAGRPAQKGLAERAGEASVVKLSVTSHITPFSTTSACRARITVFVDPHVVDFKDRGQISIHRFTSVAFNAEYQMPRHGDIFGH